MKKKSKTKTAKTKTDKRPISRCAVCGKHVTRQLEVRFKSRKPYCSVSCAEAGEGKKR